MPFADVAAREVEGAEQTVDGGSPKPERGQDNRAFAAVRGRRARLGEWSASGASRSAGNIEPRARWGDRSLRCGAWRVSFGVPGVEASEEERAAPTMDHDFDRLRSAGSGCRSFARVDRRFDRGRDRCGIG